MTEQEYINVTNCEKLNDAYNILTDVNFLSPIINEKLYKNILQQLYRWKEAHKYIIIIDE
jgi:hypothetical protein